MSITSAAIEVVLLLSLVVGAPAGAAGAGLTFGPHSLSFGKVQTGATSPPKMITISNKNSSPVSIQSISPSGNFAISSNTCDAMLAPKPATCEVSVTYGPTGLNSP